MTFKANVPIFFSSAPHASHANEVGVGPTKVRLVVGSNPARPAHCFLTRGAIPFFYVKIPVCCRFFLCASPATSVPPGALRSDIGIFSVVANRKRQRDRDA